MGLIEGLMGNASKQDPQKIAAQFEKILAPGETIEHAYQLLRDYIVFTNKRMVLVDKQGVTGTKACYRSIPYRSIIQFSVETAGTLDLDSELNIWLSGSPDPIKTKFGASVNIHEVQAVLAGFVLQ